MKAHAARLALALALLLSLGVHLAVLFLPFIDLSDWLRAPDALPVLHATLKTPPPRLPAPPRPPQKKNPPVPPSVAEAASAPAASPAPPLPANATAAPEDAGPAGDGDFPAAAGGSLEAGTPRATGGATAARPAAAAGAAFPAKGEIVYRIYRGLRGLEIGRAVQRWEIADGRYRLSLQSETSGLAALLYPLRIDSESRGRIGPQGFQPEHYQVSKNGRPSDERADFDWVAGQIKIGDRPAVPLLAASQDLLSLPFQLAYRRDLDEGVRFAVATGKKYEVYALDALGEEEIDLPAGHFRTLHLQALDSSRTEFWLALDRLMLPVKIRHTDRKGEVFEQVAAEIKLETPHP